MLKRTKKAFTLVELLIVIAILALLLSILVPVLSHAREQGRRAVCLSNIKQLAFVWIMYANNNKERIPASDISHAPNGPYFWVASMKVTDPIEVQERAIKDGVLWPYCNNLKLYKCPTGKPEELRTYSMVNSMNSYYHGPGHWKGPLVTKLGQIRYPESRFVFICEGKITNYAFAVYYYEPRWRDLPPLQHSNGTTFSFADGHSEWWQWQDPDTIKFGNEEITNNNQPDNIDLPRVQRCHWGKLGY